MSQPASGWIKVCYDVNKHLSLPSLYGYRLAIVYFRVEKREGAGGGELSELSSQSVTPFWGFSTRSRV